MPVVPRIPAPQGRLRSLGAGLWLCAAFVHAAEAPRLWFHSGFEGNVQVIREPNGRERLTGADAKASSHWERDLPAQNARFVYLVSSRPLEDYVRSAVEQTSGADGRTTRALRIDSFKRDEGNRPGLLNRNEFSLFEPGYHEAYARYDLRLQPDFAALAPKDDVTSWRMFFEIKEPNSGVKRVEAPDNRRTGTNNYRISFYIRRKTDGRFYWHVRGESPQPIRTVDWDLFNDEVPVPIDRWFRLEVAFRHAPAGEGYVWLAVDGQQVALYRGRTQHPDNPLPLKFWSPFKLYASGEWLDAGPLHQWIDNVELWSAIPADATPRDESRANRSTFTPHIVNSAAASSTSAEIR